MKHAVMAFLLCLASSLANADYKTFKLDKEVSCGPAAQLMDFLEKEYNERQVWIGLDSTGRYESYVAVLMNPLNKHWTVVQYNSSTACILGSGIQATPAPTGDKK